MSNSPYDRLEYHGIARGLVVGIYPSMIKVEITPVRSYFFQKNDSLSPEAIRYYNSMKDMGLRLMKRKSEVPDPVIETVVITLDITKGVTETSTTTTTTSTTESSVVTDDTTVTTTNTTDDSDKGNDETVVITPDDSVDGNEIGEDKSDTTAEEHKEDNDDQKGSDSVTTESGSTVDSGIVQELTEFLDLNYDDESIKSVASDAGVKIGRTKDKGTIIQKIIDSNSDYVIKLMKG